MPEQGNQQPRFRIKMVARDRRGAARFRSVTEALVSPLDSQQTAIPVQIRDISIGGIGFLSARQYEGGTALFIQVQGDGPDLPPILVAKVVHVTPAEDGGWLIGCKLTGRLSETDVQGLAARED
jgi:hypothetical protein